MTRQVEQNKKLIEITIAGANGRMGKELIQACVEDRSLSLCSVLVRKESPLLGKSISEILPEIASSLNFTSQEEPLDELTALLIDFTLPLNTLQNLQRCIQAKKAIIIGTTGFDDEQQLLINEASVKIAILQSSNMSVGINLTKALLRQASKALGETVKVEIKETHHLHKKDSPSGTAIAMGEVIANSVNKNLNDCMIINDSESKVTEPGMIKFSSFREGNVVGDHIVSFIMDDEIIEIRHQAMNRRIFAKGAIKAAIWLAGKEPGLYSMEDVLELN